MTTAHPTVQVAANLRRIVELHPDLEEQAIHKANDHEMPGGLAMVALTHVASPETWGNMLDGAERRAITEGAKMPEVEPNDWEPPLQTLLDWSEQTREQMGFPLDGRRPTIATEAGFLRNVDVLAWMWDNEPHWDDYATDVRAALARLENVLYAGYRPHKSRIVCDRCDADRQLVKVFGAATDGADDHFRCPACKHAFDAREFRDAMARQMRSDGAQRFVPLRDAVGTLRDQGRSERTIRQWFADCKVETYCDVETHRTFVWWPDLWTLHLTTRKRTRVSRLTPV